MYFFNARWYDGYLGRWCQPDSIIPDPYNPQDFDRYSYVRNNPIIFIDPTGHTADNCRLYIDGYCATLQRFLLATFDDDGIQHWTGDEMEAVRGEVTHVTNRYASQINRARTKQAKDFKKFGEGDFSYETISPSAAFFIVHQGPVLFTRSSESRRNVGESNSLNHITIYNTNGGSHDYIVSHPKLITHELGHSFDWATGRKAHELILAGLLRHGFGDDNNGYFGFAGGQEDWQFGFEETNLEVWADMFIGWAYGKWNTSENGGQLGNERLRFMDTKMSILMVSLTSP